ncbi:2-polyprenyl-6-methoxyphenol hydroxylase-like FAD-dependent oxidoreductase [Edaphobacter aggregans]|uniref:2-polyprenyl-6-methoxyphenol hydroxylase-like FAD-dependent oxidoreductase n=1 Tax=Edaphobacter aggregans TaxID=570835 RepID=A0A428MRB2_9BACT|nr:FAD-dependent oxidoreductase [Edaphobacter aggregans]RSL19441.1 2-polyprenyl-6-methoxyphenol hydroxylase-like FAD-dependent oxidoreductase [Edaphobacter aggregans]
MATATPALQTTCCIVGGGPAGMMLGYLLARDGHHVTVLEKHKDFFRDFRGDTIHPSTLELMYELGILDAFLALPHQQISAFTLAIGGEYFPIADLTHLPTHSKFVALMPQWDFLNFLASQAAKFPTFHLLMEHEVTDLIENDSHCVIGVRANTPSGPTEIHATLVVGCDGRHSISRAASGLPLHETGVPIDVLWFRLRRDETDPSNVLGNANYGTFAVLIPRDDYFQCAFLIAKDSFTTSIQPAGLPAFRACIARLVPSLADRVDEVTDWDQVKLLSVQINRLTRWHRPGLLCIGDAAHAMSPVGGIGINLAIQDAVAAARILSPVLSTSIVTELTLERIQHRRELPTRITQSFQAIVHGFLSKTLGDPAPIKPPPILRILSPHPFFRRLLARFIGMGVRPEHIQPH